MVRSMTFLNKIASEIAVNFNVSACTDVTGFGLAGHLVEMARASSCRLKLDSTLVPILDGALESASMGLVPAGAHAKNREILSKFVDNSHVNCFFGKTRPHVRPPDLRWTGARNTCRPSDCVPAKACISAGIEIAAEVGEVFDHNPEGHLEIV